MEQTFINFDKVEYYKQDGSGVSESDKTSVFVNLPMWFGEQIIKEVNEKGITVIVYWDVNSIRHIHFATTDVDLIIRADRVFSVFGHY
jgi:hypothetical protein